MTRAGRFPGLALYLATAGIASGQSPVGPELQVDPFQEQYQEGSLAAIAQDGSGLVAYYDHREDLKILRRLDIRGIPFGETQFPSVPFGEGVDAAETMRVSRGGNGATCLSNANDIACRILHSTLGLVGPLFLVDPEGDRDLAPEVELLPDGSLAVIWIRLSDDEVNSQTLVSILFRVVDPQGVPSSPVLELDKFPLYHGGRQGIAVLDHDRIVTVWNGGGLDADADGIRGRIVSRGGLFLTEEFGVNTFTLGDQQYASVAADLDGNFVVVWESVEQDGSGWGIYGQRFDRTGTKLGPEFQISSNTYSDQTWPTVAMDAAGNFAVSFMSAYEGPGTEEDSYIRAYRPDGTPYGPQVLVNEQIYAEQQRPSVALSDSGLIQVSYESWRRQPGDEPFPNWDFDVMTRRFVLPCVADEKTLCLENGRFQVRAFWKDYIAREGLARSVTLTDDSGGFWFFLPDNFELLVKVVDGCGFNQRFWIYAAGLTDLDVDLLVTDTWTGDVQVFQNPLGAPYTPVQEIGLFDGCGAAPPLAPRESPAAAPVARAVPTATGSGACAPSPTVHCLNGGRFRVQARWLDFAGEQGDAYAAPFGDDSGLFWFFAEENLELAVKVIDACSFNDRYWVYTAGLTNLEVMLTVEDTERQVPWSRINPLGTAFPAILDSQAFSTCP